MPVLPLLFVLLIGVPLVEIYVLVEVGRVIGAPSTIALVVLMALAGSWLLRHEGLRTLARVQQAAARGELPALELLEGLVLLVTGVLLLTPGFVTDVLGFLALLPPVRSALARWLGAGLVSRARPSPPGPAHGGPRTLEGVYRVDED